MTTVTLEESQDKIIERLGDCDKVPVDYMDLLSHRVRCRKIEIFHYDDEVSFTPNDEEEEQELSFDQLLSEDRTDDEDRTLQLAGEVDCLIRRIEQMQLIIKQRKHDQLQLEQTEPGTDEDKEKDLDQDKKEAVPPMPQLGVFEFRQCMEPVLEEKLKQQREQEQKQKQELEPEQMPAAVDEPLSCEEQLEVRNLQHAHQLLQCEIDELVCNYRLMRQLLGKLRGQACRENKRLRNLCEQAEQYREWSEQVVKELPVCKERYQRMLDTKLSKTEAQRVINAHIARACKYSKSLLTSRQLQYELQEFQCEIEELLEYAKDLREEMSRRFASIERETGITPSQISIITALSAKVVQ